MVAWQATFALWMTATLWVMRVPEGKRTRSLADRFGALARSTGRDVEGGDGALSAGAMPVGGADAEAESGNGALHAGLVEADGGISGGQSGLAALGFAREDAGYGPVWHREIRADLLSRYGGIRFAALDGIDIMPVARACKADLSGGEGAAGEGPGSGADAGPVDGDAGRGNSGTILAALRFYDTETTGLGTAAGTFPFLHAIGQVVGDEWIVHQYFVAAYEEEPAVLQTIAAHHFAADSVVVSFNGRTFDWPLLLNRFILYRLAQPAPRAHLDLLHPSRRLWKRALGGASLGRLETGVLGAERTDDLPGKEAPARYFRYVDDSVADPLAPVFDHNAADVSALAALLVVVADVLSGRRKPDSAGEYAALAKWYDEWQETELAEHCLVQATDCPDTTWREFWLHSLYYKRHRRLSEAAAVWQDMSVRYPTSLPPLVELAKYAEHHIGDLPLAHQYTTTAIACRTQVARAMRDVPLAEEDAVLAQLQHRLQRIERKQGAR